MPKTPSQAEFDQINCRSLIGRGFGGAMKKGHPKTKRPFSKKHQMHLILKSSHAKGARSLLHSRNKRWVNSLVRRLAKESGIEIRDYVNVGNHLHILIKCSHRNFLTAYLRRLSALITRRLLKCEKGSPLGYSFWDGRPYTKIIAEGRKPFRKIKQYFNKNRRQAQESVEGFDLLNLANTS